ncbi:receptor-type tyrosine-protein phosphatase N2-like [Nannospalax galili]|uniref:receptor-type tyrosine-protein phosphatase N2-like n=1 Tax=Nannospalax galili TaxID=1026970 RepID=UPI0004ED47D8|nr:receptor-type tyrosine-protein phosphatase N2-like [Nannospalax galili]
MWRRLGIRNHEAETLQFLTCGYEGTQDMLLRSLLKDLQQQSEVPCLGPLELEEMADAIAGAMQGDHAGRPGWPRERGRGTTTRTGEWPGSSAPRSQTLRGG